MSFRPLEIAVLKSGLIPLESCKIVCPNPAKGLNSLLAIMYFVAPGCGRLGFVVYAARRWERRAFLKFLHASKPLAFIDSSKILLAASAKPHRSCSLMLSKNSRCLSVSLHEMTSRILSCLIVFRIFPPFSAILIPNMGYRYQ